MAITEHEIQSTFFDILRLNEKKFPMLTAVFAIPNGGLRSKATAGRLKAEGVKSGVWDVCIPIPQPIDECPGGWIEFKTAKGELSSAQLEFQSHLMQFGYEYAVCRSVDEGLEFVENYLGITLSK